jgi:hypothetical protein
LIRVQRLLDPIRDRLTQLVPYPPRVEISRLGDAVTLAGAITVAARDAWPRTVAVRLAGAGAGALSSDASL